MVGRAVAIVFVSKEVVGKSVDCWACRGDGFVMAGWRMSHLNIFEKCCLS